MNLFAITSLAVATCCFSLGVFILTIAKTKLHKIWALFNISCSIWAIGTFFAAVSKDQIYAEYSWRWAYGFGSMVPSTFYFFSYIFCELKKLKLLIIIFIISLLFLLLNWFSPLFIDKINYVFGSIYYNKATLLYSVFLFYLTAIVLLSFKELLNYYKKARGNKRIQTLYLLWGFGIGWSGGFATFLPAYNILIYPAWNFVVCIYALLMTYAIFKHQLIDLKIAVTRIGVFFFVYAFVLGIPVWLGFKLLGNGLWLLPVTLMGISATIGPFIYLFLQKRAEDRLLQEQRRYQATLRQASAGMGKIKDLKKLLNMIVYVLTHAVQIEHALVYIYDESQRKYVLGASKKKSGQSQFIDSIEEKSPLVQYFSENKNPVIFEEIKQKVQDYKNLQLAQIEQVIASLEGALVVPIFIDKDLTAIIIMGKKESGKSYTEDDLGVFSILANQTALAIENAKFYEDMKLTQEQLFQAEKMATIGTMADGLSHQINNRFHALGFIAGDALDTIHLNQKELSPDKMKEVMAELDRAFVRVQENVIQGGEIVQGLLKYTRKGDAGFVSVDADAVLKAALEMVQFKIKMHELKIVREYDVTTIPKIKGNFTQLQEVFFNLIDNGYDAMMQRKNEQKESNYKPTLIVRILKEDNYAKITFEDNGMGVKDEDMHKLFTPFFTTKLSSKKGTGLGLYVIKKIVEDNHKGQVQMVSKYMQGTQMILRLPIAIG